MGAAASVISEKSSEEVANIIRNLGEEYTAYADAIQAKKVSGRVLAKLSGEEAIEKFMDKIGVPSDEIVHRMVLSDLISNPETYANSQSMIANSVPSVATEGAPSVVPPGSVRLPTGQIYSIRERVTIPPRVTMGDIFKIFTPTLEMYH